MYIIIKLVDLTPNAIAELYQIQEQCLTLGKIFTGSGVDAPKKAIQILSAKQEIEEPGEAPKGFVVEVKLHVTSLLSCKSESQSTGMSTYKVRPSLGTFAPLLTLIQSMYPGMLTDEHTKEPVTN